jgi:hypothetical protein
VEGEGPEDENQEDSFLMDMPVRKQRKIPEPDTTVLTRHFKLESEVAPLFTGGKFIASKDGVSAWGLNDMKVTHFTLKGKEIATISEENEEVLTFCLSPNERLVATTNKTYMTRVYQLSETGPKVI